MALVHVHAQLASLFLKTFSVWKGQIFYSSQNYYQSPKKVFGAWRNYMAGTLFIFFGHEKNASNNDPCFIRWLREANHLSLIGDDRLGCSLPGLNKRLTKFKTFSGSNKQAKTKTRQCITNQIAAFALGASHQPKSAKLRLPRRDFFNTDLF